MSGSGWEALLDDGQRSEGLPRCPRVVGRPSRMHGSGRETLPDALCGREAHLDDREWSLALSDVREW